MDLYIYTCTSVHLHTHTHIIYIYIYYLVGLFKKPKGGNPYRVLKVKVISACVYDSCKIVNKNDHIYVILTFNDEEKRVLPKTSQNAVFEEGIKFI
jgi:hypothetical protein